MEKHCFLSWDGSPFSLKLCNFFSCLVKKIKSASAGNRTRVYHVGGDNSTTKPPMLEYNHLCSHNFSFTNRSLLSRLWLIEKTRVLCQEESLFSQPVCSFCICFSQYDKLCIGRESNPGLSRGRRQFYH